MVTVLFSLYEAVASGAGGGAPVQQQQHHGSQQHLQQQQQQHQDKQQPVNVPLCLDLALNWLLNVYDW